MTDYEPAAADPVSDGLVVRGRPPFAMTPTSLLRNPSVSSHAVRLWSVLASYTYGDQATDRPSRAQLAADVGWKSPRSVDTYLTELQDAGYLTVQRRWRPDGGKARNLYILEWEPHDRSTTDAGQPIRTLWTTLFPQVTPMRRILRMGVPLTPTRLWITPLVQVRPMRRILRMGSRLRWYPCAGSCAYPWAEFCASGKEPTTKKEQPPAALPPSAVRFHVPPITGPTARATDPAAEADALVRVIRDRLPDRLRAQLSTATLRTRAQALARSRLDGARDGGGRR